MSAELRRFLARLAVDPEAYGRYLADPQATAHEAGLAKEQLDVLASSDQNHWYAALTSDATESGDEA